MANLADEGFSSAVYLYSKNFSKAEHIILSSNKKDTLRYYQISGNDKKSMKIILLMVAEILNIPDKGPVYLHCWNGWHQSGYIAAAILIQFCNYTNQMAYDYWVENTDGASKGYENVKERIMSFEPFSDIKIDENIKEMICPCINNK